MKTIIFCNSVSSIRKLFHHTRGAWKYLLLDWDKRSFGVKHFLENNAHCSEITADDFPEWKKGYAKEYVQLMGALNVDNGDNVFWWALNFTNKNPLLTPLCDKIFYALLIDKIIVKEGVDNLVVISADRDIFLQVRMWCRKRNIRVSNTCSFVFSRTALKDIIRRYTPVAVFFAAFRAFVRKLCVREVRLDLYKTYTVVLSLLNHQSFTKEGSYEDTYFGKLVTYISAKKIPVINLLLVTSPRYKKTVNEISKLRSGFTLLTFEYFLSFFDIIRCLFICLQRYYSKVHLKGSFQISDKNVEYLVKSAIIRDYHATYFYDNIRIYYATVSFAKKIKIDTFYYPFENRPFEKLVIFALRRFSAAARLIGYQHPSLSLRHTNFLLTEREAEILPLPDRIMTMGEITRDFMRNYGLFPERLLSIGCALRQKEYNGQLKEKKTIKNILVVLSSGIEEYIKVLTFLKDSRIFQGGNPYELWLRPHPVTSLEEAIKISGLAYFSFYKAEKETLGECFQWSDLVLYVHSTVSIEALARGIPVINLNVRHIINPDPLFDWDDFKWQADYPEDIGRIINVINRLSDTEFYEKQERAIKYAQRYFYPVNDKTLERFFVSTGT